MHQIQKSTLMPHTAKQMFDLVNAIEDYSKFLPWCDHSEVISRNDKEVIATLHIGVSSVNQSFTTKNLLNPNHTIELQLVDGPFKHLRGLWTFDETRDHQCHVKLEMEFEFANRLVGMVAGPAFQKMALSLVDAFQKRADEVYGEN